MKKLVSFFFMSLLILVTIFSCSQSVNSKDTSNVKVEITSSVTGGIGGGSSSSSRSDEVSIELQDVAFNYVDSVDSSYIKGSDGKVYKDGDVVNDWVKPDPSTVGLNAVLRLNRQNAQNNNILTSRDGSVSDVSVEDQKIKIAFEGKAKVISSDAITITIPSAVTKSLNGKENPTSDIVIKNKSLKYNIKYAEPTAQITTVGSYDLIISGYTSQHLTTAFKVVLKNGTFRSDDLSKVQAYIYPKVQGLEYSGHLTNKNTELVVTVYGTPETLVNANEAITIRNLPVNDAKGKSTQVTVVASNDSLKYNIKSYTPVVAEFVALNNDDLTINGYTGNTIDKQFKVVLTNGEFDKTYNNQSLQYYFTGLSGLTYRGTTNADKTELTVTVSGKTSYTSTNKIELKSIPVKDSLKNNNTVSITSANSTLRYNITKYNAPSVKIAPIDEESDLSIVGYTSNSFNKTFKLVLSDGEFNQYNNSSLNEYFTKVNGFSFRGTTNSAKNEITVNVTGTPTNVAKGKIAIVDIPVKDVTGNTKNISVAMSSSNLSYEVKSYKQVAVAFNPIASNNNLTVSGFTTFDLSKQFKVTLTNATFKNTYKDADISTYFSPTNGLTFRGTSNSNNNEITITVSGIPTSAITNNIALTNIPIVDVAGAEKTASINSATSTLKYNVVAYSNPSVVVNKINNEDLTITGYTQTQIDKSLKFNVVLKNAKFTSSYAGSSVASFFTPTNGLRFVGNTSSDRTSMTVTVTGTAEAASTSGIAIVNLPIIDDAKKTQTIGLEESKTGLKYNIIGYRPSVTSFVPVDGDDLTIGGYTRVEINKQFKIALSNGTFSKEYTSENITRYFSPSNGLTFTGSTNSSKTEMNVTVSGTPTRVLSSNVALQSFPIVDIANKNSTITISADDSALVYNIKEYLEPNATFEIYNPGESLRLVGYTSVPMNIKFRIVLKNATFNKVYNNENITQYFSPVSTGLTFTGKTTADNTEMEVTVTGAPTLVKSDVVTLNNFPVKDIVGQDKTIGIGTSRSEFKYNVKSYQSYSATFSPISGGDLKITGFTTKAVNKKFRIVLTNAKFDNYYDNTDITSYFTPSNGFTFIGTSNSDRNDMEVTVTGTPTSAIQSTTIALTALPILDIAEQSGVANIDVSSSGLKVSIEAYKELSGVFAPVSGDDLLITSFVGNTINKSFKIVLINGTFASSYNNTDVTSYFYPPYNFTFTGKTNNSLTEMEVTITGTAQAEYSNKISLKNNLPVKDMEGKDKGLNISEADSTLRYNVKTYVSPSASFVSVGYDNLTISGYTTVALEKTFKLVLKNATFRTEFNNTAIDNSYYTTLSGLKLYGTTNSDKTEMTIKVSGTPSASSTTAIALTNFPVFDTQGDQKSVSISGSNNSLKYNVKAYSAVQGSFTQVSGDDLIVTGYTGKAVNKKFNITLTNGKFRSTYSDTDITSLFTPNNDLKFYGTTNTLRTIMTVSISGMPSSITSEAIAMGDIEVIDMADQIKTVSVAKSSTSLRFNIREYLPTSIKFGAVNGDNLTISGYTTLALSKTFKVTLTNATFRRAYDNENVNSLFSPRNGLNFVATTNGALTEMTVTVSGTPTSANSSAVAISNVLVTNTSGINETVSISMESSPLVFNIKTYQAYSVSISSVSGSDLTISGYKTLDIANKTFKIVLKNATFESDFYNTNISNYFSPSLDLSYEGTTNVERTEMTVVVSGSPNSASTSKVALENYPILDMAGQNKTVSISATNSPLKYSIINYEPYSVSINAISGDDLIIRGLTETSLTKTFKVVLTNATLKNTYRNADISSLFTPSLSGLTYSGSTSSARNEITVTVSGIPTVNSNSKIVLKGLTIVDMANREQTVDIDDSLLQYSVQQYFKPVLRYWAINESGEADTNMVISGYTSIDIKKEIILELDYATFQDYRNADLTSYFAPSNGLTFRGTRVASENANSDRLKITITGVPTDPSSSQIALNALPITNMVNKSETISIPSSGTTFKYDIKKYFPPELTFVPLDGEELVINAYVHHGIDKTFKIVLTNGTFDKDYDNVEIRNYFNMSPVNSFCGTTNSERTVMTVRAYAEDVYYVNGGIDEGGAKLAFEDFPIVDMTGRNITSSISEKDSPFVVYLNDYEYPSAEFKELEGDDLIIGGVLGMDTVDKTFKIVINNATVDIKDTDITSYFTPDIGLKFNATLNAEKNEITINVTGTPNEITTTGISLNKLPVLDAIGDSMTVSIEGSYFKLRYNIVEPEKPTYIIGLEQGGEGIVGFTTKELRSTSFYIKLTNSYSFDEYDDEDLTECFTPSIGLTFKGTTDSKRQRLTVNVSGIPSEISSEIISIKLPLTGTDGVRYDYIFDKNHDDFRFQYYIRDFSEYKAPSFKIVEDMSSSATEITDYTYEGWTNHALKNAKSFTIQFIDGYLPSTFRLTTIDEHLTYNGHVDNFFIAHANTFATKIQCRPLEGKITQSGSSGLGFTFDVYDFLGNKTTVTLNKEDSPLKVNFKYYTAPSITIEKYKNDSIKLEIIGKVSSIDTTESRVYQPMTIKLENATFRDDKLTTSNFKTQRRFTGDSDINIFEEINWQSMSEDRTEISLGAYTTRIEEQMAGFVKLTNIYVVDMAGDVQILNKLSPLYYRFDWRDISMKLYPYKDDYDLTIWLETGEQVNKKFIIKLDGDAGAYFPTESVWSHGSEEYYKNDGDVTSYFTNTNGLKFTVSEDNPLYSKNNIIIDVTGTPKSYNNEFKVGLYNVLIHDNYQSYGRPLMIIDEDSGMVMKRYESPRFYGPSQLSQKVYPTLTLTKGQYVEVDFAVELDYGKFDRDELKSGKGYFNEGDGKKSYDITSLVETLKDDGTVVEGFDALQKYGLRLKYSETKENISSNSDDTLVLTLFGYPKEAITLPIKRIKSLPVINEKGEQEYLDFVSKYGDGYWSIVIKEAESSSES